MHKLILALMLFGGTWLCLYGYQSKKLLSLSPLGAGFVSLLFAGIFIYFAFIDAKRQ
jgi:hypothetical protein